MTVYNITFNQCSETSTYREGYAGPLCTINYFKCLQELLKNTPHYLVFIITKNQIEDWHVYSKKYEYTDFIYYEMPYFVSNPHYPKDGRKLKLIVLKGIGTDES